MKTNPIIYRVAHKDRWKDKSPLVILAMESKPHGAEQVKVANYGLSGLNEYASKKSFTQTPWDAVRLAKEKAQEVVDSLKFKLQEAEQKVQELSRSAESFEIIQVPLVSR